MFDAGDLLEGLNEQQRAAATHDRWAAAGARRRRYGQDQHPDGAGRVARRERGAGRARPAADLHPAGGAPDARPAGALLAGSRAPARRPGPGRHLPRGRAPGPAAGSRPAGAAGGFGVLDAADAADLLDLRAQRARPGVDGGAPVPAQGDTCSTSTRGRSTPAAALDGASPRPPRGASARRARSRLSAALRGAQTRAAACSTSTTCCCTGARRARRPRSAPALRDAFDHVLVDEYQDVNALQVDIVRGAAAARRRG